MAGLDNADGGYKNVNKIENTEREVLFDLWRIVVERGQGSGDDNNCRRVKCVMDFEICGVGL